MNEIKTPARPFCGPPAPLPMKPFLRPQSIAPPFPPEIAAAKAQEELETAQERLRTATTGVYAAEIELAKVKARAVAAQAALAEDTAKRKAAELARDKDERYRDLLAEIAKVDAGMREALLFMRESLTARDALKDKVYGITGDTRNLLYVPNVDIKLPEILLGRLVATFEVAYPAANP